MTSTQTMKGLWFGNTEKSIVGLLASAVFRLLDDRFIRFKVLSVIFALFNGSSKRSSRKYLRALVFEQNIMGFVLNY